MDGVNENEIGEALIRLNNAGLLISLVKKPLEQIVSSLQIENGAIPIESDDTILLLVFTYIDLLGYLYTGKRKNTAENAVQFLRDYLGRIDIRYKQVGGLLYEALRHGLVHLGTPKRILLQNGKTLDFSFARNGRREDNLRIFKSTELEFSGERVDIHRLVLDIFLF